MVRIENHCCDCEVPAYQCQGASCPLTRLEVHYCDHCGEELDDIYDVDDEELCGYCLKEMFRRR